jgi:hypothetical protein
MSACFLSKITCLSTGEKDNPRRAPDSYEAAPAFAFTTYRRKFFCWKPITMGQLSRLLPKHCEPCSLEAFHWFLELIDKLDKQEHNLGRRVSRVRYQDRSLEHWASLLLLASASAEIHLV